MHDDELRRLERRWKETRASLDARAYLAALQRRGDPAEILRVRMAVGALDEAHLLEKWFGIAPRTGEGYSERDIKKTERRLGVRLPTRLVEWARRFGKRAELAEFDRIQLLPPAALYVADDHLCFARGGRLTWGVGLTGREIDEESTVFSISSLNGLRSGWGPLSLFHTAWLLNGVAADMPDRGDPRKMHRWGARTSYERNDLWGAFTKAYPRINAVWRCALCLGTEECLLVGDEDTVVKLHPRPSKADVFVATATPSAWAVANAVMTGEGLGWGMIMERGPRGGWKRVRT